MLGSVAVFAMLFALLCTIFAVPSAAQQIPQFSAKASLNMLDYASIIVWILTFQVPGLSPAIVALLWCIYVLGIIGAIGLARGV